MKGLRERIVLRHKNETTNNKRHTGPDILLDDININKDGKTVGPDFKIELTIIHI